MTNYETKRVIDEKEVATSMSCDCCGKEINGHYFTVFTGHNDWGNDSPDSFESSDYCSVECLTKAFNNYYTNGDGKRRQTSFFEIDSDYFKPNYKEVKDND